MSHVPCHLIDRQCLHAQQGRNGHAALRIRHVHASELDPSPGAEGLLKACQCLLSLLPGAFGMTRTLCSSKSNWSTESFALQTDMDNKGP